MECFVATTGNASRRTSIVVAEPSASRQNCLIANDPANGNRFVSDGLTDTGLPFSSWMLAPSIWSQSIGASRAKRPRLRNSWAVLSL
jgi:hypothetical protein